MFSTDLIIFAIIALCLLAGLLMGHQKVKMMAFGAFAGLVLAGQFSEPLRSVLAGHGVRTTTGTIGIGILAAAVILLSLGRRDHAQHHHAGGAIVTLILSVLTAGLIVAGGLSLLGDSVLKQILTDSNLASQIYSLKSIWLAAVPGVLVLQSLSGLRRHDPHRH